MLYCNVSHVLKFNRSVTKISDLISSKECARKKKDVRTKFVCETDVSYGIVGQKGSTSGSNNTSENINRISIYYLHILHTYVSRKKMVSAVCTYTTCRHVTFM